MTRFTTIRGLLLSLAFALMPPIAFGRSEPTARSAGDTPTAPDGVPLDGLLIVAGIVAVMILLAWVCSRVSDSR